MQFKVRIKCTEGCWHSKFIALILFRDKKSFCLKKRLNAFEPATSCTARTLFVPNYSATVKSSILKFFLHYYTAVARSALKGIWCFVYTFGTICRSLTALARHKKCASERRIFDSSPIFEISLKAALPNTLRYLCNTPEHRRVFLASL